MKRCVNCHSLGVESIRPAFTHGSEYEFNDSLARELVFLCEVDFSSTKEAPPMQISWCSVCMNWATAGLTCFECEMSLGYQGFLVGIRNH